MGLQNNTTTNYLSWSITRKEKRERTQKILLTAAIPLIILGIISATIGNYPDHFIYELFSKGIAHSLYYAFFLTLVIAITLLVFFLINKIFPYAERLYFIDSSGINITKGKRNKKYLWEEFECYYPYSERGRAAAKVVRNDNKNYIGQSFRGTIYNAEKNIAGDIFYLKKKRKSFISKMYKKFVVVYGEAENSSAISKTLSRHLTRKTMNSTSDLGLVFYEFK